MNKTINDRLIIFMVILMIPLSGAGVDIHVPSLPSIINYFHTSKTAVQTSVTTYLIGYGIGQLVIGIVSDNFGRRPILLMCTLLYALACLGSTISPSIHVFLITRLIQGFAVAGPAITAKAIIVDCFKGDKLHKASNYMTIAWAAGPILAPALGGFLQHFINWKACFYFLLLYSLVILAISYVKLPETKSDREKFNIKTTTNHCISILTHPVFIGCFILNSMGYSVMIVFNVLGPFIIQTSLHYSALEFGSLGLLLGLAFFTGNLLNKYLLTYFSVYTLLAKIVWAFLFLMCVISLIQLHLNFSIYSVMVPTLFIFLAGGMFMPNGFAIALSLFPKLGGTVNALLGALMMALTSGVSIAISHLETHNQIGMTLGYLAISIVCFAIYYLLVQRAKPNCA